MYTLYFIRVFINIACFKWPKLLYGFLYTEYLVMAISSFIPVEVDFGWEIMYLLMLLWIIFFNTYFNFLRDLCFALVPVIPMFFNRYYFHGDNPKFIMYYVILVVPWHALNLLAVHLCITKAGFLFIEAELLRGGNEQVLDGLEEGVVIIGEKEKDILYYNNAAMRASRMFTETVLTGS